MKLVDDSYFYVRQLPGRNEGRTCFKADDVYTRRHGVSDVRNLQRPASIRRRGKGGAREGGGKKKRRAFEMRDESHVDGSHESGFKWIDGSVENAT